MISVSPAKSHPMWCFRLEGNFLHPFVEGDGINIRSQDLPLAYTINGGFYLIAPDDLRKQKSFYSKNMLPLVIDDSEESIDIDTESDWKEAESIYASTIRKS